MHSWDILQSHGTPKLRLAHTERGKQSERERKRRGERRGERERGEGREGETCVYDMSM